MCRLLLLPIFGRDGRGGIGAGTGASGAALVNGGRPGRVLCRWLGGGLGRLGLPGLGLGARLRERFMPGPVTGADTCLGVATGVVKRGFEAFAAAPLDDGAEAAMDAAGTAGDG